MTKIYSYIKFLWNEEKQIYEEIYSESKEYEGDVALCGKGGGGGGDSRTEVRFAPYVEQAHQAFLEIMAVKKWLTIDKSPFSGYTDIKLDDAFFGAGYLITSFPALYYMYGKFMSGLDINVLYAQIFEDTVNASAINNLVSAEAVMMDDDIDVNVLPRFQVGLRDINSVISSSYVVGKAMIEDARVKALSKFSAGLKYQMIPVASERWKAHLDWNKGVVGVYAELMKLYFSAKMDVDNFNYSMAAKNLLWPFTVLEYERAALGALQGATNTKTDVGGSSTFGRAISGALGGAAMGGIAGAMIAPSVTAGSSAALAGATVGAGGGPIGIAIGGILGLAAGLFS